MAAGNNIFNSTANTSWTAPQNGSFTVECWGGGGGGGSYGRTISRHGGSGGGGGAYVQSIVTCVKDTVYTIGIGVGGANGANNAHGSNGGNTHFNNNEVRATFGGRGYNNTSALSGIAGNAGNSVYNVIGYNGGNGAIYASYIGGGGGSGSGNAVKGGNGGNGTPPNGGTAPTGGGGGGSGGADNTAGVSGSIPGGGGGGAGANVGTTFKQPGSGANGQIKISWPNLYEDTITEKATASESSNRTYQRAALITESVQPVITDNFSGYSGGSLAGQGLWLKCKGMAGGGIICDGAGLVGDQNAEEECDYYNTTISDNQYSQVLIYYAPTTTAEAVGVSVRCSGDQATSKYYGFRGSAGTSAGGMEVFVMVNGTKYTIATSTTRTATNDVLKLVVNGSEIRCYRNGVIETTLGAATAPATGSAGIYYDTRVTTGKAGLCGIGVIGDSNTMTNFECGGVGLTDIQDGEIIGAKTAEITEKATVTDVPNGLRTTDSAITEKATNTESSDGKGNPYHRDITEKATDSDSANGIRTTASSITEKATNSESSNRNSASSSTITEKATASESCDAVRTTPHTFYVSTSGSNSADGLTITTPWQTLAYAASRADAPGDIVALKKGDTFSIAYLQITKGGSAGTYVTWDGSLWGTGANAIIQKSADSTYTQVNIYSCQYVKFQKITVEGNNKQSYGGITIGGYSGVTPGSVQNNEQYITVQDCVIQNVGEGLGGNWCVGIHVQTMKTNISHITIQRNTIARTNNHGIGWYNGKVGEPGYTGMYTTSDSYCGYNTITKSGLLEDGVAAGILITQSINGLICEHNTIYRDGEGQANGISMGAGIGADLGAIPVNIIVRYNDVRPYRHGVTVENGQAQTAEIYYNTILSSGGHGINIQPATPDYTNAVINIYNNTIVCNSTTYAVLRTECTATGICTFKNNLMYSSGAANWWDGSLVILQVVGTVTHSNNLYYRTDTQDCSHALIVTPAEIYYKRSVLVSTWEATAKVTNPLLVDVTNLNWHIHYGSPAVDLGVNIPSIPQYDYDGVTVDDPPDAGAYQKVPFTASITETSPVSETQSAVFVKSVAITEKATNAESSTVSQTTASTRTESAPASESVINGIRTTASAITEKATNTETQDAPGGTYHRNITEKATNAETTDADQGGVKTATIEEKATAGESNNAQGSYHRDITEKATAGESSTVVLIRSANIEEKAPASESQNGIKTIVAAITEKSTASESQSTTGVFNVTITETAPASDISNFILLMFALKYWSGSEWKKGRLEVCSPYWYLHIMKCWNGSEWKEVDTSGE